MTDKINLVPALPLLTQSDWNTCFNLLENPIFELPCSLSPAEETLLAMLEGEWLIVFHWVIKKKWLKKHKIPGKPMLAKLFEPKATYWYWVLELCIQLHTFQKENSYQNAGDWYKALVNERKAINLKSFDSIVASKETEETKSAWSGEKESVETEERKSAWLGEKESVIKAEKHLIGALRKSENPFDVSFYPHHHNLFQTALQLKDSSDQFRSEFWNPFLTAYSGWIESLRANFASCHAVGENILVQKGQGKFVKRFEMPNCSNYKRPLIFIVPEPLKDKGFKG